MNDHQARTHYGAEVFDRSFKRDFMRAHSKNKCFVKHVNLFTGFGKTHQSASFAIDTLRSFGDVYSIFLVPTQAIAAGVQESLEQQPRDWSDQYALALEEAADRAGLKIPIYRIYSMEYLRKQADFHSALISFGEYLRSNPQILQAIKGLEKKPEARSPLDHVTKMMKDAKGCLNSPVMVAAQDVDTTDENEHWFDIMGKSAYSEADWLMKKLVQLRMKKDKTVIDAKCFSRPHIAGLFRKILPVQAFVDEPGIIVTTASKAMTQVSACFALDEGKIVSQDYVNLPAFVKAASNPDSHLGSAIKRNKDAAQFLIFIDEEEESYWYKFDSHLSQVNKEGDNDLNEVLSQFLKLNDINLHDGFGAYGDKKLAQKIYRDIKSIAAVSLEFTDALTKKNSGIPPDDIRADRLRAEYTSVAQGVAETLISDYSNAEIDCIIKYILSQDAHASFAAFKRKASVIEALKPYISTLPGSRKDTDADKLAGLFRLIMNKKYFTMNRVMYGEVLDQPMHTFFSDNLSVMSTDFLKRMRITPATSGQTLALTYEDGPVDQKSFTLYHYVQLLLVVSRLLADEKFGGGVVPKSESTRYRDLMNFKVALRKTYKASIIESGLAQLTFDDQLVDDSFVYESLKSVISLRESFRQNLEYNAGRDIALTVSLSALKKTPEDDIDQYLGTRNGVYLMSATGGLNSASSGAFNMQQLRKLVADRDGFFFEMSDEELKLVQARREYLAPKRERHVSIFETLKPEAMAAGGNNYSFLSKRMLQKVQDGASRATVSKLKNIYKVAELNTIIAALDLISKSDITSAMVLTQSLAMIKPALKAMALSDDKLIEMIDVEGDVYLFHQSRLQWNEHLTDKRPVRIVLYKANRFATKAKDSLVIEDANENGQFSPELHQALDTKDAKVCLISAYKSASRGLNFQITTEKGQQDFEMLVLANDPYYTRHTRTNSAGFSMESFQSFCQVRKDTEGDSHAGITQSELLYLYQRHGWKSLEPEHYIEILRIIMQSLGRVERRPELAPAKQYIYIANDAAHQINLGLRHAQELPKRASLTQLAVFKALDDYLISQSLFGSPDELRKHHKDSKRLVSGFRRLTKENSREFRDPSSDSRRIWENRFDERMFTDPVAYVQHIAASEMPEPKYAGACFFGRRPFTAMFVTNIDEHSQPLEVHGQPYEMITDHQHGTSVYDPSSRIVNHGLLASMSKRSQQLMQAFGKAIAANDQPYTLVPQPWFAMDIMKGFIAEIEFEELIRWHFSVKRKSKRQQDSSMSYLEPMGHAFESDLYQLFDYYLEIGADSLVAVDIKNWAPMTDRYQSDQLLSRAEEKLLKLKALFPGKKIRALYINLQGVEKISIPPRRQGDIQFFSMYVRNGTMVKQDDADLAKPWRVNTNFIRAISEMEGNDQ